MNANFADVRIHTDAAAAASAAQFRARAFTMGSDIFFGAGRYAPHTTEGVTRLAHELVHVEQQRNGRQRGGYVSAPSAEREARDLGASVAGRARVRVQGASPAVMQRDGPEPEGSTAPAFTPPAGTQLQLDPEIERLMLQHYIRWWLGTTLVSGDAPSALPTSPDPDVEVESEPSPDTSALPPIPGLPLAPIWAQLPLEPSWFTPLPPDPLFIEPDVGSLYSAFSARGAPVGEGDSQVVMDIYRRNQVIARNLPDLRGFAPRFLRPLIPSTWRRDIAGALTGAAVGAYLNRDYMTPIEVSDRAWQGMTGASTTVIPLPSVSFDLF